MRGHEAEALTCRFGGGCRQGLNCPYRHSQEEIQIFVDERDLRRRKLLVRCGFCARGECKFEGCCARSLRVAAAVPDAADSDYESADSNDCADDCAGDGSASDSASSGVEWESGSDAVRRESEEEWREDRRPSRREAIRECIYSGELQQSGGRYEALVNDGGPDDGLLRPEAREGAELEVDKPGFAFACREEELECRLTAEEWGWAALQRHGGAAGEAGGQTEAVERQAEAVSGAGATKGTGEAPSGQIAAVAPQVPEEVTEEVPAPGASVEERQDWFQSVLQKFEESEMGVVWKQRRQEWEAEGWMQPAVWDQCLEWIEGQWGAVDGVGQLETLLDELRYGAGAGLVRLQLWQWRQQQFGAAVGWWRQQHLTWRLLVRQGARQQFGSAVGWWRQQQQQQQQQQLQGARAGAGWCRLMAGLSKLTWRGFRRVFRKQRRATRGAVGSSVVVAELVGAVMWMGWQLGWGRRAQEAAAAKEVAVGEAAAAAAENKAAAGEDAVWEIASECSEGYCSGGSSDTGGRSRGGSCSTERVGQAAWVAALTRGESSSYKGG